MYALLTPGMRAALRICGTVGKHLEDCPYPDIVMGAAEMIGNGRTVVVATYEEQKICLVYAFKGDYSLLVGGWSYGTDLYQIDARDFVASNDPRRMLEAAIRHREMQLRAVYAFDPFGLLLMAAIFVFIGYSISLIDFPFSSLVGWLAGGIGIIWLFFYRRREKAEFKRRLETGKNLVAMREALAEYPVR